MWLNFLFPLLCMFLLCKTVTFHVPKSWDWNSVFLIAVQNPATQGLMLYPFETNLYDMKKKPKSVERYIGKKKQWERNILVPRALILLTSPMDWESSGCRTRIMGISAVCTFTNLWGSAENQKYCDLQLPAMVPPRALIHGIGQKDENKKKSRKNWYESGRKNYL